MAWDHGVWRDLMEYDTIKWLWKVEKESLD